jgi:hypothetical protein
MNGVNLKNIRRETSRIFWKKESEYLKYKSSGLENNNKKIYGICTEA